jgi:hypothetical protein
MIDGKCMVRMCGVEGWVILVTWDIDLENHCEVEVTARLFFW